MIGKPSFIYQHPSTRQARDVPIGGGASCPQYFQICMKVGQKAAMLEERVVNSIFCDLLFSNNSWLIGQTCPPPQQQVSLHITETATITGPFITTTKELRNFKQIVH